MPNTTENHTVMSLATLAFSDQEASEEDVVNPTFMTFRINKQEL